MLLHLLRVKIQQVVVSESSASYPGSIALPDELLEASGLKVFEQVHVNNLTNGNRILTYVVPSRREGYVSLNGAASKLFKAGDQIHVIAFAHYTAEEAKEHQPLIVYADENNRVLSSRTYSFNALV